MANIFNTFAILKPDCKLDQIDVTPEVYQQLDNLYGDFAGHSLIAAHAFKQDWPTWEVHPQGDELVTLLTGRAEMILRTKEGDSIVLLENPGDFVIVPKGIWHTARISAAATMFFVTPGEGTVNATEPYPLGEHNPHQMVNGSNTR